MVSDNIYRISKVPVVIISLESKLDLMSRVQEVLGSSFKMLVQRPQLFIPKLFSTFFSSIFLIFIVSNLNSLYQSYSVPKVLGFVALSVILLSFIGFFVSLMVASMVRSNSKNSILSESFYEVLGDVPLILKSSLALVAFSFLVSIIFSIGLQASILTGNIFYTAIAAGLGLLLILGVSFGIYFLPITLLEESGLTKGLKSSLKTSKNNSVEVTVLLIFSFLLLGLAAISTGIMEKLQYLGFLLGRLISTVVNTYLFVVSPKYYLEAD